MDFRLQTVEPRGALFDEVLALHAKKKSTLGPFPRGAFEEHAAKQLIWGAVTDDGRLAGYVLCRKSRAKASIVHLTRHDNFDGKGVIKLLVERVLAETKHLLGVALHCRQDYNLKHMWAGFGFTIRATKPGRGKDGVLLDYWWYDHGHGDLFSQAAEAEDCPRLIAVMDANVFYDLIYVERPHHEDTSVLQADWLEDSLELCVTRELFAEIERSGTPERKEKARREASGFRELKVPPTALADAVYKLNPIFGELTDPRDISDRNQLAHAIAAGAPFFVTRDDRIIARGERVLELFPIEILHPTTLVNRFDVLQRAAAYRPALLENSSWQRQLLQALDVADVVNAFKHPSEKNADFERQLRGYLAHPAENKVILIRDPSGEPAALQVITGGSNAQAFVPLLRHSNHPAAPTIIRHAVHDLCTTVPAEGQLHVTVTERHLSPESGDALQKLGFIPAGPAWHKLSLRGIHTLAEAQAAISRSSLPADVTAAIYRQASDEAARRLLEQILSPVKISSASTDNFVVSIRAGWAEQLFNLSCDGQALLNTDHRLLIGTEGVYYCSAANRHLRAPSRVLWYVSQGPGGRGPMSVVACSQMEEILVGKPKEVFAKYRNLGVYSWLQVFDTAGNSLTDDLLAFRFARTERFTTQVTLPTLESLGIPQPQNPRKITDDQFTAVYRLGMNLPTP